MKYLFTVCFCLMSIYNLNAQHNGILIDHNCCQLENIPESYISQAKASLILSYGHTSHGSQIVSGMDLLNKLPNSIYLFNDGENTLKLYDNTPSGDLGNSDWNILTRNLLASNNTINTVMWSWCGQADGSSAFINEYLDKMSSLENEFPNIHFIYMTGHLNGSGENGNLHLRNNQIRDYCSANNKILFDFADIESYDPDGNYFLNKNADDGCNYDGGNWAEQWCSSHPDECPECDCAHSHSLNCLQKGRAFWWMMARIAGWDGIVSSTNETGTLSEPAITPNPVKDVLIIKPFANDSQKSLLRVLNINGQTIFETTDNIGNGYKINTEQLQSGVYFLQIINKDSKICKFIKQ